MYLSVVTGGKVIPDIGFFVETHGGSSRSFACLHDARLELSLECRRREGKAKPYLEHTPTWFRVL
jgi:hypothetical protein